MIAGGGFATPGAEVEDLSAAGDNRGGLHMLARAAIFDRIDTAGIVGDHAANRRHIRAATGRRWKKQAPRAELLIQPLIDNAGLDTDLQVFLMDLNNRIHA